MVYPSDLRRRRVNNRDYPTYEQPEAWGMGPADEDDERAAWFRLKSGPYGPPTGPRPYQRAEQGRGVPRGFGAQAYQRQPRYHYPYYGFGYTGYGQFGGGYGAQSERMVYGEVGPYSGVGPRGYSKSDPRILEDVNEALAEDSWLDASDVEVSIQQGQVTLTGTVDSRQARRRAAEDAWSVAGVLEVRNDLNVRPGGSSSRP